MDRRIRRGVLALAAVSVVGAGGLVTSGNDTAVRAAVRAARGAVSSAVSDPLSVLAGRSPGERGYGALAQSKPYRRLPRLASSTDPVAPVVPGSPFVPTERVLSGVRSGDPLVPFGDVLPVGPAAFDPGGVGGFDDGPAGGPVGAFPSLVPGTGFAPPVGGGGGILPPNTPPVSPVPEPAGWTMMIVGALALGAMLRRRGTTRMLRHAPRAG